MKNWRKKKKQELGSQNVEIYHNFNINIKTSGLSLCFIFPIFPMNLTSRSRYREIEIEMK